MTIFLPSLFVFFSQSFGIRSRDLSWKRAFAVGATKNCVSYIQTTLWTTGNWRKNISVLFIVFKEDMHEKLR